MIRKVSGRGRTVRTPSNHAIAVVANAPTDLAAQVQKVLTSISGDEAKALLPPRYTGFVAATHASYSTIEKAGIAVGRSSKRNHEFDGVAETTAEPRQFRSVDLSIARAGTRKVGGDEWQFFGRGLRVWVTSGDSPNLADLAQSCETRGWIAEVWHWISQAWPPTIDEVPFFLLRTAETVVMAAIGTHAGNFAGDPDGHYSKS